jgi:uncharacterized repeat protein (TIGR03806 family)
VIARGGAAALALALAAGCGGGDDGPAVEPDVCAVPDGEGVAVPVDGELCDRLSTYRLFTDVAAQTPAAGLRPFDLNTPLFSDYTDKARFLWLPPGAPMTWSDGDTFAMPVGTLIAKTFAYPRDRRERSLGRRLLETRLLVHQSDGWKAAAYVYDPAGADAPGGLDATISKAGDFLDVDWIHDDGAARHNRYVVPNINQCGQCHEETVDRLGPIGPKARHLNRAIPGGGGNQLAGWIDRGELTGAPAPGSWPSAPVFDDPEAPLDVRARAWLDINCAHCHNPRGAARTSGLDLSITQTDPAMYGVCKAPVAAGTGSGGRQFGIVPGQPDASIFVFRLESTEPEIRMPELGRNLVHTESLALIRAWIEAMPGSCTAPP